MRAGVLSVLLLHISLLITKSLRYTIINMFTLVNEKRKIIITNSEFNTRLGVCRRRKLNTSDG